MRCRGCLRAAVAQRSEAERRLLDAAAQARKAGASWAGTLVGTSGEAGRQPYASKVADGPPVTPR
jgi:hypothetical protein